MLANEFLKQQLACHGYFWVPFIPELWKHVSQQVQFTLVVDDFVMKDMGQEHEEYGLAIIQQDYTVDINWREN